MYAYRTAPINFAWKHLKTVVDTAAGLGATDAQIEANGRKNGEEPDVREFLDAWSIAKEMAGEIGWDGDFSNEPVVFWVPCGDRFRYGFAFKQAKNGRTFVISPVAMPWLNND